VANACRTLAGIKDGREQLILRGVVTQEPSLGDAGGASDVREGRGRVALR